MKRFCARHSIGRTRRSGTISQPTRHPVMHQYFENELTMIASSYATWVEAEKAQLEHGLLVKGRDGAPAVNPFRKVANEAYDRTRQLLVEFGMTPSSRTRVKVATPIVEDAGTEWWERSG